MNSDILVQNELSETNVLMFSAFDYKLNMYPLPLTINEQFGVY